MVPNFDIKNVKWSIGRYGLPEASYKIKIPSVSRIINEMIPDPEMEEWVRKVGQAEVDKIMQLAGYRGTAMHMFIENFISTYSKNKDASEALRVTQTKTPGKLLEEEIPQKKIDEGRDLFYKFYYSQFSNLYANVIGVEMAIYSPFLFYRGKADIFFYDRVFGPAVTDFKTSNGYIKKGTVKELKYKYQLGAYANALDEMYKTKNLSIKKSTILCVNTKTDDLQEIVLDGKELEHFKNEFKTLVRNYHIKNNQEYLITI